MSKVSLPGFRTIGVLLLIAAMAAGVAEWRGAWNGDEPPPAVPVEPQGAARPPAVGLSPHEQDLPGGVPGQPANALGGVPPTVVEPVDPAVAFMNAVKAARDAPQPVPAPGVLQARTLPEAFEAMQRAQREPPAPLAGVSPFGAPAR